MVGQNCLDLRSQKVISTFEYTTILESRILFGRTIHIFLNLSFLFVPLLNCLLSHSKLENINNLSQT